MKADESRKGRRNMKRRVGYALNHLGRPTDFFPSNLFLCSGQKTREVYLEHLLPPAFKDGDAATEAALAAFF